MMDMLISFDLVDEISSCEFHWGMWIMFMFGLSDMMLFHEVEDQIWQENGGLQFTWLSL